MNADPLTTTLIDLTRFINDESFKLILGGGFGLYLKQIYLQNAEGTRTLLPGNLWPYPRATEDLDVFLPTEVLVDLDNMKSLRAALDALHFQPDDAAKFLHFVKPWGNSGRVKIDMLTGPISDKGSLSKLKLNPPRVRPRGKLQLHAYLTEEALDVEESLLKLTVQGVGSDGRKGMATVYIPQAFTFLLMKLHAFADRVHDADRDLGRHHALDVYRIIAMMTSDEYDAVRANVLRHQSSSAVQRARNIIHDMFASETAVGAIRLREHALFTPAMDVKRLIRELATLFQPSA